MTNFAKIFTAIGDLFKTNEPPLDATVALTTTPPVLVSGIHLGLTDQQLVVILTAAAYKVIGVPIRIEHIRHITAKNWGWVAQGRSELHTHRLK